MKFFTPELYLRGNSLNNAETDQAEADWERAIQSYEVHRESVLAGANDSVKELASNVCLHDASLLCIKTDSANDASVGNPSPVRVASIALKSGANFTVLNYILWDQVTESARGTEWPFSPKSVCWLYDEIDRENLLGTPSGYWHRILLSDGRVLAVPFQDVTVFTFSERDSEPAIVVRER